MATATKRKRKPAPSKAAPTAGWWGDGPPPWERWPGVSIYLEAKWVAARARWETKDGRYYFDPAAAQLAVDFFPEFLTHFKGDFADQPFRLRDDQDLLLIRPLFGWMRASDGLRRFRKVFYAVPKGNGKSPLAAGLALKLAYADREAGAEIIAAAADREQAAIVFDTAKVMVESNQDLFDQALVWRRAIELPASRSFLRVVSADVKSKHGPNIHGLVIDEFHAQPTRELYETLGRGTIKRRQPVTFLTTTAGDDEESICAEEWDYAHDVIRDPARDESYLPVIFEAAKDDDWKAPATWKKVNPGFGSTVKADAIEAECRAAQNEPRKLNDFLRYHLNRWVNQATAWIPVDWWDECRVDTPDDVVLRALPVYGGLDLAQKDDLAALTLVFLEQLPGPPVDLEVVGTDQEGNAATRRLSLNFALTLVPHFWIPEETMREHQRKDRVPYDQWVAGGFVTATEGNIIDNDRIYRDIVGPITTRFPRLAGAEIGYDPAFATDLALKLQAKGYKVVEIPQNYRNLSEPSLVFEAFVKGHRVHHNGQPVLREHLMNVAVKRDDAFRIRPVKPRRKSKRIDGIVATLMGIARAIASPPPAASVYEERGVLAV